MSQTEDTSWQMYDTIRCIECDALMGSCDCDAGYAGAL